MRQEEIKIISAEQLLIASRDTLASPVVKKISNADIRQFLRFCIVGSLNAGIDFLVLNMFLWAYPTADNWHVLGYNSIAVMLAATNSFFCNKYWTFQQRHAITLQEVFRFTVLAIGTTLMNDSLMLLLSLLFPGVAQSNFIGANILKLGAIIGTLSVSFFGMRLWVFFQKRYERSTTTDVEARATTSSEGMITYDLYSSRAMKTLIIIPTYNESENLPQLLQEIFLYAPETDVLIVDDNSPDGTGRIAEDIKKKDSRLHVLHRAGKLGLGTAYIAGFKYAIEQRYDAAFEMDADFSHHPRYLPDFLKAIKDADLVIGSRYIRGGSTPNWSLARRLISGSGNVFARFMLGIPVHDCTGGFRCYRREVLEHLDLNAIQSRGYAFQIELTYHVMRQGFKIVETPITFMDRRLGTSKMSRKIVLEAFTYVVQTRFAKHPPTRKPAAPLHNLHNRSTHSIVVAQDEEEKERSPVALAFPSSTLPRPLHNNSNSNSNSNIRRVRLRRL